MVGLGKIEAHIGVAGYGFVLGQEHLLDRLLARNVSGLALKH